MKLMQASEELLKEHYNSLRERPFFSRLVKFMSSGPIVAMVRNRYERLNIRSLNFLRNVIHGSDSVETAQREIALWFRSEELICWKDSREHWIYE
ncbi:putative Nucleoside diphosphate kinase protein [Naja naja]|nr:putative Nucleoside diphosphate kinase protein [Naja naja]